MAWFIGERRGPQWKQGWKGQTLSSLSLPPPPLIIIFFIVLLFLSISWQIDYQTQAHRAEIGLRFLFVLLIVALIIVVRHMFYDGQFIFRLPWPDRETVHHAGSSPWGVAALLVVLLVMVSYQSSFQSQWLRPLWS